MNTELSRLFGLTVPVIAAPMAGVADARLAIAVSRAGALGCIGIGSTRTAQWVDEQVARAAEANIPFGVGFMGWALDHDAAPFDAALAANPALVSISFADPIDDLGRWVGRARAAGAVVAVQIGTIAEAVSAERIGASLIVARGSEAGGHGRNDVATLPLLQEVLETVHPPVLAAGGISGSRGLAAVLAAGAAGAWVGTAFAGCIEATSSPAARQAMSGARATDTRHTRIFDIAQQLDWPRVFGGRALENDFTAAWADRPDLLQSAITAPETESAATISAGMARALGVADVRTAPVYCGQGVSRIHIDVPASDVVAEFARATELLRSAAS
ncbi:MAG: nitronate monooxygenase [Nakamurella sp.]